MNSNDTKHRASRVLLVDDDKDTLAVLKYLFESAQLEVVTVSESIKVLEEYTANNASGKEFDLIALDIRMPSVNGNELAQQIRGKGYKGPIIALTAAAAGGGRRESKDSGFNHYFGKKQINKEVILAILQK